jgi:hypothetical protein
MKLFYSGLFIALLLLGCAKDQPEVAWLKLEPWVLQENNNATADQGAMSHNISQAFVNMDGEILGAFELPVKIPVIGDGDHNFIIIPGIINNGISNTKRRYPFMEQFEQSITLKKNDTVSVTPTTRYFSDLTFLVEDFESPAIQFEYANQSTVQFTREDDPEILQWGGYYGSIVLSEIDSLFSARTTFGAALPKQGAEIYLEMDYYNTNSMLTSVLSFGNGTLYEDPNIQLNPQENPEWKHIYIELKELVSFRTQSPFAEVNLTSLLDKVNSEQYVYLDNIKVIYR